jgi:hypothetical protein
VVKTMTTTIHHDSPLADIIAHFREAARLEMATVSGSVTVEAEIMKRLLDAIDPLSGSDDLGKDRAARGDAFEECAKVADEWAQASVLGIENAPTEDKARFEGAKDAAEWISAKIRALATSRKETGDRPSAGTITDERIHWLAELAIDNGEGGAQKEVKDEWLRESLILNVEKQMRRAVNEALAYTFPAPGVPSPPPQDWIERCCDVLEQMKPPGGRQWSEDQALMYDVLTAAQSNLRALLTPPKESE